MPERPCLEHGGREYQRQKGTWLYQDMFVSRALSLELDGRAKEDADFWEQCQAQDFKDDPRNRGRMRLGKKEAIEFGLGVSTDRPLIQAPNSSPTPVRGYQSVPGRRRKRDQTHLDSRLRDNGELVVSADIEGGWRPTERMWYFHASAPVVLPREHGLSCVVTISEDVSGYWARRSVPDDAVREEACDSVESVVPYFARCEKGTRPLRSELDGFACTFVIQLLDSDGQLNTRLPWRKVEGRWRFEAVEYGLYEQSFRLQVTRHVSLGLSQSSSFAPCKRRLSRDLSPSSNTTHHLRQRACRHWASAGNAFSLRKPA
jgi:hypothetical protein